MAEHPTITREIAEVGTGGKKRLFLDFRHGLGDCVHFIHLLELYRRRGFDVNVHQEQNKAFIWTVAGYPNFIDGPAEHVPWIYSEAFFNLRAFDIEGNKITFNLNRCPLPSLGEKKKLWNEIKSVQFNASPFVSSAAHHAVDQFLDGLPRPICLFHAMGNTGAHLKDLSPDVQREFQTIWLELTAGSLIVVDWDHRAEVLRHPRVRSTQRYWQHMPLDLFAAMCDQSDMFVGVDSGPLHFTSLTNIKSLGVWRKNHPNRCGIPRKLTWNMVSARHGELWDRECRRLEWNLIEYPGAEPTGSEIADAAHRIMDLSDDFRHLLNGGNCCDAAGKYIYVRVGHDQREMVLLPNGTISVGSGGCEQRWTCLPSGTEFKLAITGVAEPCYLKRDADMVWRGRWTHSERMEIELHPIESVVNCFIDPVQGMMRIPGNGFWVRLDSVHSQRDRVIIEDVYARDLYAIRHLRTRGGDEFVLDIGAHLGAFAALWHERNPEARITCVEPLAENVKLLRRNVGCLARIVEGCCYYHPTGVYIKDMLAAFGDGSANRVVTHSGDGMPGLSIGAEPIRDVQKYTIEELLELCKQKTIDVLKLSCRGSECNILANTTSLDSIRTIIGEFHDGRVKWEEFAKDVFRHWHCIILGGNEAQGTFRAENLAFKAKA